MTLLSGELYTKEQIEELNRFEFRREVKEIEPYRNVRRFIVNCLMCNKECAAVVQLELFRKKFCSLSCSKQSMQKKYRGVNLRKKDGAYINCKVCEKSFWQVNCMIKFHGNVGKTCSKECAKKLPRFHKQERAIFACQNIACSNMFEDFKNHPKLRYCSTSCATAQTNRTYRPGKNAPGYKRTPKAGYFKEYTDRLGRVFRFRSSYEIAFVSLYLDKNNLAWDYEPKKFVLDNSTYTPDFYIKEYNYFVEVKGFFSSKDKSRMRMFREMYPDISLVIATADVLKNCYSIKDIRQVTDEICKEYKIKTKTRRY